MDPTRYVVHKQTPDGNLGLHIFEPAAHKCTDRRACIVFFFGGGWAGGSPSQFFPHCSYLASRGMIAVSAEYRVRDRHGVSPYECVADGKSAVRWLRVHADTVGIDPQRLAAGGGSAGGHVAACTATIPDLDDPDEDAGVSSKPDALVLFNPVLMLEWDRFGISPDQLENLRSRFQGRDALRVSPCHHVTAELCPTLILHGEADTTVPLPTAQMFVDRALALGARCELVTYAGEAHGFFNFGRGERFYETLSEADRFLSSLDLLTGDDTGVRP